MASVKKNYLYETIYQILILIIPFLVSPYVSRVLKAEGLGIYSYTNAVVTYFTMLATLGIRNYGSRMAARCSDKIERSRLFWGISMTHLLLSGASVILYFCYVVWLAQYKSVAWIQGLNVLAAVLDISWFFTGMENFKILTTRNAVIKIFTCISVFLFVKDESDVLNYVAILSIGTLTSALFLMPYARKYICWIRPEWEDVKEHIKPIFVLAIPTFLTTIYTTMDKVLLGVFANNKEVAFYENSEKMLIVRNFIYSIGTVMLPRISALYAKNELKKIRDFIKQSTEISLIMCYAFTFGLIVCAKDFAPLFWGGEFKVCGQLIIFVAVMMLFNTVANTIRSLYLIPIGRDREYVTASAIGAFSNVALDILLIPFFQATGAWAATLLSSAFVCIYQMWIVRKELPMLRYCICTRYYFFLGVAMLIICKVAGSFIKMDIMRLLGEIFIGMMVYLLGCYVYWKKTDKRFYTDLIKRKFNVSKKAN